VKLIKAKEIAKKLPYCRIIIPDKSFEELEKDLDKESGETAKGPKISTINIGLAHFYRRSDFNFRFGEGI